MNRIASVAALALFASPAAADFATDFGIAWDGIDSLDQLLQQFWVSPEMIEGGDRLQVDLPLGLFASVALDAVLCEEGFE